MEMTFTWFFFIGNINSPICLW